MKLIKSRKAKRSDGRVYIQDRELLNTQFQPNTHFSYVVDLKRKRMIIRPAEEGNTVSKRQLTDGLKSVIDIRDKEKLHVFQGSEYLQFEIYDEQIVVSVYEEVKESRILSIQDYLVLRHQQSYAISREVLAQASGDFPVDLFDYAERFHHQESFEQSLECLAPLLFQAASLFSGAGLMDEGAKQEGFEILYALERDSDAVKTYRYNHGDHIVEADIYDVDLSSVPRTPVMFGGSPCQGFSNSNRRTNFLDNPNNQLVVKFIEAIETNPDCQVFVLENVPQILTAGEGRFRDEIYERLSQFEITSGVLLAADYGTPQLRKRAFFIGSKIGRIELPSPERDPSQYQTVAEALHGLHEGLPNQQDVTTPGPDTVLKMSHVPPGGNFEDIPEHLRGKGCFSNLYRRLRRDHPSVTLANFRKANITHPEENRILTVREAARLSDLSDDFIFPDQKLSSKQQQIANGVPVRLARAVFRQVKNAITQFNIRLSRRFSFV